MLVGALGSARRRLDAATGNRRAWRSFVLVVLVSHVLVALVALLVVGTS